MTKIELRELRMELIKEAFNLIKDKLDKGEMDRIVEASIRAAAYPLPGPDDEAINNLENIVVVISRKYDLDDDVIKIVDNWSYDLI